MLKYRWRNTLTGRIIRAPRGLLGWLLKALTVKERVKSAHERTLRRYPKTMARLGERE